ncbi:MAG TPA: hypothetical protein VL475_03530 [Planctomycetaceae bacterium]|nr:hypothetical protein [Planctomycetaceae bacterium]
MQATPRLVSRMSIFILSYVLLMAGLQSQTHLHEFWGVADLLAGTAGIVLYFALDWSATSRASA